MPEISSYIFKHKELLELLVKKAGVHEGKWMLLVTFGFTAGNVGPSPEELSPGAFVAITNIGIQRATPESPAALTIDASEVNPAST